jgi:hypothetical protein
MTKHKIIALLAVAVSGVTASTAVAAPNPYGRGIQDRPRVVTTTATVTAPAVTSVAKPYGRG